jgi:hypothetical protein
LFELIIRKEYKNKKQPQFKLLILNFLIESHFKNMSLKKVLENVAVSRNIKNDSDFLPLQSRISNTKPIFMKKSFVCL